MLGTGHSPCALVLCAAPEEVEGGRRGIGVLCFAFDFLLL